MEDFSPRPTDKLCDQTLSVGRLTPFVKFSYQSKKRLYWRLNLISDEAACDSAVWIGVAFDP
jgi:hypothetical protein